MYLSLSTFFRLVKAGSATPAKYLCASGLLVARIEGSTTSHYHQDALGSTCAVTHSAGAIALATQHKPFGIE